MCLLKNKWSNLRKFYEKCLPPRKLNKSQNPMELETFLRKLNNNSKSPMELKTFIRKLDKNQNLRWSWNFIVSSSIILSFNDWSVSKLTLNKLLEVLCQIYSCYEYSGNWRHGSQRVLGNFYHDPNECTIWIVSSTKWTLKPFVAVFGYIPSRIYSTPTKCIYGLYLSPKVT